MQALHERLVDLVDKPTWKTLLVETVQQEGMDPWDIDVSKLTHTYIKKINAMRRLDFRIPANAVLASAILVRFKSDSWELYPQALVEEELEDQVGWEYIIDGDRIPELKPGRRITKRKVTIDELVRAVEEVIEKEKVKAKRRALARLIPEELAEMAFEETEDFERAVDEVYKRVLEALDSQNIALFSHVLKEESREETIKTLIPLLHLATHGRIAIWQEKIFGDIYITLVEEDGRKEAG